VIEATIRTVFSLLHADPTLNMVRYLSESGDWQLGGIDFSAHLAKYRDHNENILQILPIL
jgi:hypothetical protein